MNASKAKTGDKYLTRTGIPVTMAGIRGGKALLKLETTGTTIAVNGEYELKPYSENGISRESRYLLKAGKGNPRKESSLAAFIDPLLLAGGHTVKEIAAEIALKAGDAAKGKDLEANVRARLVTYTRKDWQVIKDDKKRVKTVQPKN